MTAPLLRQFLLSLSAGVLICCNTASAQNVTGAKLPADPASDATLKHFIITDYGALADGTTLNSAAIQKTIEAAAANPGGGVVEIPKGTFLSGSIFLKKGVQLYLDEGAVLLGSQNIADYPKQKTRIEGHFTDWRVALVNVTQMDHVRIGGKGQLNGNGAPYWAAFRAARGAANLDVERPRLMFVDRCTDVHIEGISFQDSGFWNLHLYNCHNVLIEGLHINAPGGSPSTDGIDVDSCSDLTITKTQISNNDDDIALKGSKGPFADKDADSPPDENILIEDCEIGNGNGLITCGSEATIVRNVLIHNCRIVGNATMLTLKLRPDTPQHYSNITIDGVTSSGAGRFINVAPWTQYFDLQGQPSPARSIDNLVIRNVTGSFGSLGSLRGTEGDAITNVTFENINLNVRTPNLTLGPTKNIKINNFAINGAWFEMPEPVAAAALPRARAPAGFNPAPSAATGPSSAPAAQQTQATATTPATP